MGIIDSFFKRIKAMRHQRSKASAIPARLPDVDEALSDQQPILVAFAQSTGLERKHNEDALLVMVHNSAGEESMADFALFVVADGMGGHRSGEIASAIAARTFARRLAQDTYSDLLDYEAHGHNRAPILEVVRQAFMDANRQVVRMLPGGGTTLTAVVMLGEQLTIGHVGDSRAYVISENETKLLTRDHTFPARLLEMGEITQEEVNNHPQRHVLYRAIGQGDSLEVDVFTHPMPHGNQLLVCSDGLWGVVPNDRILDIVSNASHPQDACDELILAANQGGGPDNITAVLVRFPPRTETEPSND